MIRNICRAAARGFTLIEILIVVVILGILAAIIIPQFTNAADDASVNSARTQLQTMRSQVELFRYETAAYPAASGTQVDWSGLITGGYIRAAPTWPALFEEKYTLASGDLKLTFVTGTTTAYGLTTAEVEAW